MSVNKWLALGHVVCEQSALPLQPRGDVGHIKSTCSTPHTRRLPAHPLSTPALIQAIVQASLTLLPIPRHQQAPVFRSSDATWSLDANRCVRTRGVCTHLHAAGFGYELQNLNNVQVCAQPRAIESRGPTNAQAAHPEGVYHLDNLGGKTAILASERRDGCLSEHDNGENSWRSLLCQPFTSPKPRPVPHSVLIMQTCNMSGNPFLSRRKVSAVSDSSPAQVALPFRSWQDQCRWWLCAASCNRPQVFTRWTRPWKQSLSCVDGTLRALLVQLGCFRLQGQGEIVLSTHAR